MHTLLVSVRLGALFAAAAFASPCLGDPQVDCSEGGRVQYELNVCADRAADSAEKLLNEVLVYVARFDKDKWTKKYGRTDLRLKAQSAWAKYREAQCRYDEGNGSSSPMR